MSIASDEGMRAVLDTNVLVSALTQPRGRVAPLWRAAQAQRYRLLISPAIINEIFRVLREDLFWEDRRIIGRTKQLARTGEIIVPQITVTAITADPDDNRILECAMTGKADVIVSGDRHLRSLQSYQGVPIVKPVDFLRTLGVA